MPSKTAQSASPPCLPGYSPVHPRLVDAMDRVEVDLFRAAADGQPVLFCKTGPTPTLELAGAQRGAPEPLYVRAGDVQRLMQGLSGRLEAVMGDDALPTAERFRLLQCAVAAQANQAFALLNPEKFITLSEQTASNLVAMLTAGAPVPEELFRVARRDYSTFAHASNVSCYAVLLAMTLGVRDERELRGLALGAMLHDLGKRRIPIELLQKSARLSRDERSLLESHPQRGYEDLVKRPAISRDDLMVVYQHHERLDGSGYPVGVAGEEIHPWARIAAIANVFDATTSCRAYRDPDPPRLALERLEKQAGSQYDREMVQCWTTLMKKT